jgi:uncharacterized protein
MLNDPVTLAVAALGIFVLGFLKGAFGGGFAIIGIPLLSLVMDPIAAGALMAPMLLAMDMVALRYWKPSTWSAPDLQWLLPALIAGIGLGGVVLAWLDPRAISIAMALVTLLFAALWVRGGGQVTQGPRVPAKAVAAGVAAGITTMVAHAGGPPLAMYLLPRGLSKTVYGGTTSVFFTAGNIVKVLPWLYLAKPSAATWQLMALCLPMVPLGVWTGWQLHERLNQAQMYRVCYGLLTLTALKLLWTGVAGYVG